MLEIAAFGKISVGKSALLNAVFDTDVFTVDVRGGSTFEVLTHDIAFGGAMVRILDTPGIGEVGGYVRTEAARACARAAHLVLVVFDSDPTQFEYTEIEDLAGAGKPLLVVVNKADALTLEQRLALLRQVRQRLANLVDADNILICAANPIRHCARDLPDGSLQEWSVRAPPDVAGLRQRLLNVYATEGEQLQAIEQVARSTGDREQQLNQARGQATAMIDKFALGIAAGVAVNPIPLIDVFGAGAGIGVLIARLAKCYDAEVTQKEVSALAYDLVTKGWKTLWKAVLPIVAGSIFKSVPFVGWALSAVGQATGAYYVTYILGEACSEYFARDKQWAGTLRETLKSVIANTDRKSLSRRAAEQIKRRLEA